MINITVPTGVAGRVTAQVYKKDKDGNKVKVEGPNKSCEVDNIITQAGLNSIDGASLMPNLRHSGAQNNHYIGLGEGTQGETLGVEHLANGRTLSPRISVYNNTNTYTNGPDRVTSKRTIKYPTNKVSNPTVHEIVLTCEFSEQGVARNYTEVGLIGNPYNTQDPDLSDPAKNITLTYTLFRDENGLPTSIAVAADEYILISYTYQIQVMLHFPVDVPVTGTGIPGGVVACLYRRDEGQFPTYSKTPIGIYYYQTMDDFNNSGWAANFDKFHHPDGNLFGSGTYPSGPIQYALFKGNAGGNSIGRAGVTIDPLTFSASTPKRSISSTVMNVTVDQGGFNPSVGTPVFMVAWGCRDSSSIVTFNTPIPFAPKYDKTNFHLTINYDTVNEDWIDVSTIV